MARSKGRTGRPWRRVREQVLATSDICHLCGHGGAGDVDHHPFPLAVLLAMGIDPRDPAYLRPAHGSRSRCPVCLSCCNQAKGDRLDYQAPNVSPSRVW